MKKTALSFILMLSAVSLFAQENGVEMADKLRASGKIYVVVAVMLLLFTAFILYLFSIDKRLKKVEKGN
ncbi:CcmD family protein [Pelobium manganitolerans]|uniref:CcmD family protein n=1 Tax=Pelobium manganitolerans TaxID=1842495 RepID=A0A419S2R9_9SPHI|nr:CcmD family protein [Pelobium manganitolerans]RKD13267.1 CcmD family protein [Pelobium manganitolerans]